MRWVVGRVPLVFSFHCPALDEVRISSTAVGPGFTHLYVLNTVGWVGGGHNCAAACIRVRCYRMYPKFLGLESAGVFQAIECAVPGYHPNAQSTV